MNFRFSLNYLSFIIFSCLPLFSFGQAGGYEASWGAGIFGMSQNPATTTASVYKANFTLGALNSSTGNNRFSTNNFGVFSPPSLFRSLGELSDSQPFTNDFQSKTYATINNPEQEWSAYSNNKFIGPGGFWRLELDADWVERGLSRMTFSLWLERNEAVAYTGIDESFVGPVTNGLSSNQLGAYEASDDQFSIAYREWDALALNYGLSLGRGNKLIHIAFGGKLLSAGAFMNLDIINGSISQNQAGEALLNAGSVHFAYNPGFEKGIGQGLGRRYKNFEYSWGLEGNIGVIYQSLNYNREPVFEGGIGIQGLGAIQFWNLTNQTYTIQEEEVSSSDLMISQAQVSEFNRVLSSAASTIISEGPGITEKLPISVTLHAKQRINSVLGLQVRAVGYQQIGSTNWHSNLRGTFCIERKDLSVYIPVSYQIGDQRTPYAGVYLAVKNRLVVGSEDILSNLFLSATRKGVTHSNLFLGLHFPLQKDY